MLMRSWDVHILMYNMCMYVYTYLYTPIAHIHLYTYIPPLYNMHIM